MGLVDAIRRLGSSLTVARPTPGAYIDGRYVDGAPTTIKISASVQPAGGRDLLLLEEGSRVKASIVLVSPDALLCLDVVTWNGEGYQVQHVEPWTQIGGFYRAVATKVQP